MDPDTINVINAEQRHEEKQVRALKGKIMAMTPGPRKTAKWQENFPRFELTGEIINSPVY